jgi:hypothetical protein
MGCVVVLVGFNDHLIDISNDIDEFMLGVERQRCVERDGLVRIATGRCNPGNSLCLDKIALA